MFLMGCALGIVIPRALYRDTQPLWAPGYLTAAAAYSLLILGEPCFWNIFGFDRSAAQMYFLTPVKFTRVLLAKNITAALWLVLQLGVLWGLGRALRSPIGLGAAAEAAAVIVVTALLLWSAGNFVSVRVPMPGQLAARRMLERGVQINAWADPGYGDFIRITVGTKDMNEACVKALGEVIARP